MSKHSDKNLFFLTALAIALTGLGSAATKTEASDSTVGCPDCSNSDRPAPITTGFYRESSRPEVYLFEANSRNLCHVQNPSQMESFGGFGQVRVVQDFYLSNSGTTFVGNCIWPSGFYRKSDGAAVYFMFDDWRTFCHVANPEQMNRFGGFSRVRVVTPNSVLDQGRRYLGDCGG